MHVAPPPTVPPETRIHCKSRMNTQAQQRSIAVHVGGSCELACAPCDCRTRASELEWVRQTVREGGRRLSLRGAVSTSPRTAEILREARQARIGEIAVRTNALAYADPAAASRLAAQGVHAAIVPVFSQHAPVHDRIAGRPEALVQALLGMRALAAAGLAIELEVPLLPRRLQEPAEVVRLAHRAVDTLRAVHFIHPRVKLPGALAPPPWSEGAPLLAAGLEACRELGVRAELRDTNAVPLCALGKFPSLSGHFRFNPSTKSALLPGATLPAGCDGCSVKAQCPGVADAYLEAHGERDLVPFTRRPRAILEQRTTPRREWTDGQREAARRAEILVLRPTVNCNQDCTFCSANESTGNVWSDRKDMYRAIARAARRGIQYLSFSGGEPTLSKDLPSFVSVAKRCGIREIEIVTNAVLLDSPKRVAALREAGLTNAFVSLHAHEERVSQLLTQKVGDWERTVRGIGLLVEAGVEVTVNHVVSDRNYRLLPRFMEFMHARFGRRVGISLAFVTPQYKALEQIEQVPRLSAVAPYLRRALRRAVALGLPVVVGSRQGVPPCFLGEFRAWSDVLHLANESRSEDQPQKTRGPQCESCAYSESCNGLWKPYAARFGTGELTPVPGPKLGAEVLRELEEAIANEPFQRPTSFEQLPELLRDRERERAPEAPLEEERTSVALPVVPLGRTRPVRLLMLGSGRQARRLALAARLVRGLSIDAVASPHAPDVDLPEFQGCPTYRDAAEAMDDLRPEGVIIAAATAAHPSLAALAMARGIPVLLEKPLARTEEEAASLGALASGAPLIPAHNVLFAPGLDAALATRATRLSYVRRTTAASPEALRLWSRAALLETLHHALAIVVRACGGPVRVLDAQHRGDSAPERVRVRVASERSEAEIVLDFQATRDEATLVLADDAAGTSTTWTRTGRAISLVTEQGPHAVEAEGGELERMLAHFRDVILGIAQPAVTAAEALEVLRATQAAVDALEAAGAPLDRPNAPKHVASRQLVSPSTAVR
jgi:molybdenum cofactor biosynthesis enzyme MoaA/predicted dehydrogenase